MIVEKVYFQENFNVEGFYWQSAGHFGSLEEGETKEEAMNKASKELRQYFMNKYPNAPLQIWQQQMQKAAHSVYRSPSNLDPYSPTGDWVNLSFVDHSATAEKVEDFKPISIGEQISTCRSPVVLKALKGLCKTEVDKVSYEFKMNELLNQPITNSELKRVEDDVYKKTIRKEPTLSGRK